ncbi:MAG: hypothetical protein AB8B53_12445 [Flavobacteriales bacterium]
MLKPTVLFSVLCMLLMFSCKEETPFETITYKCECGSNTWNGESYELTDAHWITVNTEVDSLGIERIIGKEYYTTAKVELEDELEPHHINMRLRIDSLNQGVQAFVNGPFFYSSENEEVTTVSYDIQDVNFNNLSVVDEHAVIAGAFDLVEGSGGVDEINFQLEIVRLFEGSAAGLPFIYSGSILASQEGN